VRKTAETHERESIHAHVASLIALLDPHVTQEEQGIFAELRKREEFTAHIDALFAQVSSGGTHLAPAAIRLLRDHIEKEENGLFPAAAVELEGTVWQEIAERGALAHANHLY